MADQKSTSLTKAPVNLPARVAADRVITKLREAEKALQFATTIQQAKIVADVAAAQELFAHRQRLGDEVEGYAHEIKTYALAKLGDLLREMPKATGVAGRDKRGLTRGSSGVPRVDEPSTYAELGIDKKTAAIAQQLSKLPEPTRAAIASREVSLSEARREAKRREVKANLEDVAARDVIQPSGEFDVIVIDPPWPMEKIERDLFPEQVELDYPTMDEATLRALTVPAANDCHVWLWTTHRFLPLAFQLLDEWTLKYVCTFVWHKPGGFQPVGLPQYNCEFALYARRGSPIFIDTKALPTCFSAPRGAHSEKPEEFYDMVRRVTAGRRLDMFNRRQIEGFSGHGKEAA